MKTRSRAIKRILVGTDFSRPASNALFRAAMLAAEHSAKLEIVHIAPRIDRAQLKRFGLGKYVGATDAALEKHLAEAHELIRAQGITSSYKLLKGSPPAMLAQEASRVSADLIVLGYCGERSVKNSFIGTTAERILEHWAGDTLVVRHAPKQPYGTILACVALSPVSDSVILSAAALSERAHLHVLHVFEPMYERMLASRDFDSESLSKYRVFARQEAARGLDELIERCPMPTDRPLLRHIRKGYPATLIPSATSHHGADLVVVGKNLSMLEEFFLGSVTKRIIRTARTDILVSDSR